MTGSISGAGGSDPEKDSLRWFLDAQRASVLAIVAGLPEEGLRARVLPSGWTPIGLIEHLGHAERHWFQDVALGSSQPLPWLDDDDSGGPLETNHSSASVFAFYQDQCRRSNVILAETSLSARPVGRHEEDDGLADECADLRWIAMHLIEETARHAGHLDVVRELLDGRTGLGPR
jgi:hypothetical protein